MLEEIGVEFRDFPRALELWKDAGADIDGERVRFPRGLCRSIVQASAPREYTQHARNPDRSTIIGGDRTVFVPAYGSPFVRDLDHGRRYATLEDFRNFVKLAYMSPGLHHSGGTICEPVDIPVNKRHFDMVYSHIKYSDKPFMGSVTAGERAQDTVDMAKIVFGDRIPDETTILNFRHLLERHGLTEAIFAEVNGHLADKGITLLADMPGCGNPGNTISDNDDMHGPELFGLGSVGMKLQT